MTRRRRPWLALAGLLVAVGCGAPAPLVTVGPSARPRLRAVTPTTTPAPPVAVAAPTSAPPPPATEAPVPATAAATTVPPAPVIATHDATLGALAPADAPIPVAVDAGGAIAISGPVVPAGVDAATGELAVPADASVVAWYEYGPAPGQPGSAVLAGHVDWHGVAGIFFRLDQLQPGDPVSVTMSDGSVLGFHVVDAHLVGKPELPRGEVFARTGAPTLTLVTCGGEFDSSTRHYLSNVVVTAVPD